MHSVNTRWLEWSLSSSLPQLVYLLVEVYLHTTYYTAHINFLYNCFLRIRIQPEDGYCWKAETCSCTLGSNVNTHLLSNRQVVLD